MTSIRRAGLVVLFAAYVGSILAIINMNESTSNKWWIFSALTGMVGFVVAGPMGER